MKKVLDKNNESVVAFLVKSAQGLADFLLPLEPVMLVKHICSPFCDNCFILTHLGAAQETLLSVVKSSTGAGRSYSRMFPQ